MNYSDIRQYTYPTTAISSNPTPEKYISRLINSLYFFLDIALIVIEEKYYRLIVYDKAKNFLVDKRYTTAKGARIAFMRFFRHKYYNDKPRADWSFSYPPDWDWLENMETLIASLPANSRKRTINKTKVKNEGKGNRIDKQGNLTKHRDTTSVHQRI
jgi:hypothetical protein